MKKIRVLFYSAGFVVALSASFAFRPASSPNVVAYFKTPGTFCTTTTTLCNGGSAACVINQVPAYLDQGICTMAAGQH